MRTLFNTDWLFAKSDTSITYENQEGLMWAPMDLPHDWLIFDTANLYETSYGHYKKILLCDAVEGMAYRLYFEGVYMDATVYVNSHEVISHPYGYSSFEANLTPYLHIGENEIYVLVRHVAPNTRWYSGAGIYRDVWLSVTKDSYLTTDGVYFHTKKTGKDYQVQVSVETVLSPAASLSNSDYLLSLTLSSPKRVLVDLTKPASLCTDFSFAIEEPDETLIWDLTHPNLLTLTASLLCKGTVIDSLTQKVGLRDIDFTTDAGFFLNGRHVKLHGVCLHHDLGCLGAAYNASASRRMLLTMKEMGVNAIRTSHNMPAVGFMELCDELGLLVDSEAYDMWERPKTEFDNARFFPQHYKEDVASWVRRDRNHPSVIMWSVGNEIYDTHASSRGCEVAKNLHEAVRAHDPLCNAYTTIGSNYMEWEGAQNCAMEVDLAGYNYGERLYERDHTNHPEWKIYGSETTAGVKSRGIYHFPLSSAFLTHEDLQCSSLGNCKSGISAETAAQVIQMDAACDYCAGMFIWTGADYIGEPSPYSTKNSYFGNIDTAGLKKDIFYLYQAAWTNQPVLHLLPYWDYNEGQLIDVVAYTNLSHIELFVNGISQGVKEPSLHTVTWQVPYAAGSIRVVGTDGEGNVHEAVRESFQDACTLTLNSQTMTATADGESIVAVEIHALDIAGRPVANANSYVHIEVEGGTLVGYDNGDSTDYDSYQSSTRKLFSGAAVAYIGVPLIKEDSPSSKEASVLRVHASAEGLSSATLEIALTPGTLRKGAASWETRIAKQAKAYPASFAPAKTLIPVRKITLTVEDNQLTSFVPFQTVRAKVYPDNATDRKLVWSVINDSGIVTNLAEVVPSDEENTVKVHALGDGSFRLRCCANNGKPQAEIVSEYEFSAEGLGSAVINPYEPVPGCLYTDSISIMDNVSEGGVNITATNNIVGFTNTDFGRYGTKNFAVSVINWFTDAPFTFHLWLGYPGKEGSRMVGTFTYQAEFLWQTYKKNEYTLPELITGTQDVYFEFEKTDFRISFGSFVFTPRQKAYLTISGADCDLIHGDSFQIEGEHILGIGNNVHVQFDDMVFTKGTKSLTLTGRTHHEMDSIHVRIESEEKVLGTSIIEFPFSQEAISVTIPLDAYTGRCSISFIFLPGCDFDFHSFTIA